jgi:hypothetical protein
MVKNQINSFEMFFEKLQFMAKREMIQIIEGPNGSIVKIRKDAE